MRLPFLVLPFLAGCVAGATPTPVDLPLMGGYRDAADQCQRVGESAYTVDYLDDAADLVACPEGAENLGVFVTETGAIEITRVGGFVLYTVPRR